MDFNIVDLTSIATSITAVFSSIAALAAWKTVLNARKQNEGQLFQQFREKYASNEMGQAIKLLADIYRSSDGDIQRILAYWSNIQSSDDTNAQLTLNTSLRLVSTFFDDVGTLVRHNIISKKMAKDLIDQPGFDIFLDVCIPIHRHRALKKNDDLSYKNVDLLQKKIVARYNK